ITDPKEIADTLANHYEQHFSTPQHDMRNQTHQQAIDVFNNLAYLPPIPLTQIKYEEVLQEWKKMLPKKIERQYWDISFHSKKTAN
ncbi:unnamed protein product, partial [Rotaria socialis]